MIITTCLALTLSFDRIGAPVSAQGPAAGTIELPLDHFNASDTRTFTNRYWFNDTVYKAGGPVFFFDNGEAGVSDSQVSRGLWVYRPRRELIPARWIGRQRRLCRLVMCRQRGVRYSELFTRALCMSQTFQEGLGEADPGPGVAVLLMRG